MLEQDMLSGDVNEDTRSSGALLRTAILSCGGVAAINSIESAIIDRVGKPPIHLGLAPS